MDIFAVRKIIELPRNVADKIAAGEVVDRPLSIVKELVENAIDAGSTSIVAEIRNGGKTYIRITDNGSGIRKEDVELAFKRHATSKIRSAEELDHIQSLGFRGEALTSIAAVSRVELITKTAEEKIGVLIKVEGGEVLEKEETGCPEGTTIIVEDLFYNTPARLKFMKSDAAESTLIIDFISKMTLAYPHIKMRLVNNGNILFSTSGKGDIYSNILTIYSRDTGDKLIHIKEKSEKMIMEAFISPPNITKTNRKSQIFFVNGRHISSKVMENAVTDAYVEKVFEGRYPIAFIFLLIAPEKLDVNIHPNKKEVRFEEEIPVKDFISSAIRKGLNTGEAIPEIRFDSRKTTYRKERQQVGEEQVDIIKLLYEKRRREKDWTEETGSGGFTEEKMALGEERFNEVGEIYKLDHEKHKKLEVTEEVTGRNVSINGFNMTDLTVTGSIFGTYITAVDEKYLYLIDQHAAHERIFYEQLLEQYQKEEKLQQIILTPIISNVNYSVKNAASGMLDFLHNFGFEIEEFGPKAFIIKAIPAFMSLGEATDFIEYLLDNISEEEVLKNRKKIDTIIISACKSSVKAHDILEKQEIERLISDLSLTKNPYSCPHGRPTFIRLSQYEIEKMFKRV